MFKNIILHLHLIDQIGPQVIIKIVESLGISNLEKLYSFNVQDFVNLAIPLRKAELLRAGLADREVLERELATIKQYNVNIVTLWCREYSQRLAEIDTPPVVLYCLGNVDLLGASQAFACVGARKAHGYVKDMVKYLVMPLAQQGWVIVSGGALGADSYAHDGTLSCGGFTIAVLGGGLCHMYPPQNKLLFQKIIDQGGLIISSFPMNLKPVAGCFPARNRIIAGLSRGCLVLQAAEQSGALITAYQALEQGRDVFAVPGSIFDPLSAGCHRLIQQGAKLVTHYQDILDELTVLESDQHNAPQRAFSGSVELQGSILSQPLDQVVDHRAKATTDLVSGNLAYREILNYLAVPMTADALLQKMSIELTDLQNLLFELSLEGAIAQDDVGLWRRV